MFQQPRIIIIERIALLLILCLFGLYYSKQSHLTVNDDISKKLSINPNLGPNGETPFPPKYIGNTWLINDDNLKLPPLGDIKKLRTASTTTPTSLGLLDFAVIGFAKTGTSTLLKWLNDADDAYMVHDEQCQFVASYGYGIPNAAALAAHLSDRRRAHPHDQRGLKCPGMITSEIFPKMFGTHFSSTKLILGLRHPIERFQSFYNFRLLDEYRLQAVPLANQLIGSKCHLGYWWHTCTDDAGKVALPMMRLGKTPLNETERDMLTTMGSNEHQKTVIRDYLTSFRRRRVGTLFLYDMAQFEDENSTRKDSFRRDLGKFLGFNKTLPELPKVNTSGRRRRRRRRRLGQRQRRRQQRRHLAAWDKLTPDQRLELRERNRKLKINICAPVYKKLRKVLIDDGRLAARWIIDYFLESDDVVVSSRDFLVEALRRWGEDPCDEKKKR